MGGRGMIEFGAAVLSCALTRWRPQIGDPTIVGWLTVVAYLAAAAIVTGVAARPDRRAGAAERWFWTATAAALLALAVNKQLDLQSLLTATGRCAARLQGWYGQRRAAQLVFVLALIGAAGVALAAALLLLRRALSRVWLSLVGMALLTTFVVVRAVGFHHVDALLGVTMLGVRFNWAMELGAIALVAAGALLARSGR